MPGQSLSLKAGSGTFSSRYSSDGGMSGFFSMSKSVCADCEDDSSSVLRYMDAAGRREKGKLCLFKRKDKSFVSNRRRFCETIFRFSCVVVMNDKNKWTFFRMLSCFVSFLASFGGKPRAFFFSLRRRLLLACVGTPKRTRTCASRTHRSSHFLPSPFTFTRNALKMGEIRVNFRVILTLRR